MTAAIVEPNEEVILKVSSSSDPHAVSAAIFRSIFDSLAYPTVRAIGHGAIGQATKSIAIARGNVAVRGIDLACNIGFETITGSSGDQISSMVFRLFPR
jgi:stage V sporulation protein S